MNKCSQMSRMFKLKAEKNVTKELKKGRENGDWKKEKKKLLGGKR